MEKAKFNIIRYNDFCRIEANNVCKGARELSDGACISSMDILLNEMQRITDEGKKIGLEAYFEIFDVRD